MRARQERDRMLHRMRGPEGDEARRTGRMQNGPRPRGPAPLVQRPNLSHQHAQRQQQLLYHDSPQVTCLLAMNLFYVRLAEPNSRQRFAPAAEAFFAAETDCSSSVCSRRPDASHGASNARTSSFSSTFRSSTEFLSTVHRSTATNDDSK
jgi:hypothetical protein